MKTIEIGGAVKRVGDKDAQRVVEQGKATYISKSRWKAIRDAEVVEKRKQGIVGVITNEVVSLMPDGKVETAHRNPKKRKERRNRAS